MPTATISAETRLGELIQGHPYLVDFLAGYRKEYEKLRNPILRATVAKVASLSTVAEMGGVPVDELIGAITSEMARHGDAPTAGAATPAEEAARAEGVTPADLHAAEAAGQPMREVPPEVRERQQAELKSIIRDLHAGQPVAELKARFARLASQVGPGDIAQMEQALIAEGMPVEEIQGLCDVHVQVFKDALEPQEAPEQPPGHPVDTFRRENRAMEGIVSALRCEADKLAAGQPADLEAVRSDLTRLADVERHYLRKEYQLFPFLEAHGISGPSNVMWSTHDHIREELKKVREQARVDDARALAEDLPTLLGMVEDMVYKEEKILFPVSLEALSDDEWMQVRAGEPEIGYAWIEPTEGWHPGMVSRVEEVGPSGLLPLQTGALTAEQIGLVMGLLPFDVTFVDENDEVRFYSEGDRVFPRSPAVIGRNVANCHPPKSVHIVKQILDAFRAGERDVAEFWIQLSGRFVHIRYFAVRDSVGDYRGCLEVVQDATHVRSLVGERRLLDWS